MKNESKKLESYKILDRRTTLKNRPQQLKYTQKIQSKQQGIKLLLQSYIKIKQISKLGIKLSQQYPYFFNKICTRNILKQQQNNNQQQSQEINDQNSWLSQDNQQYNLQSKNISNQQIQKANIIYKDIDQFKTRRQRQEIKFFQEQEKKKNLKKIQQIKKYSKNIQNKNKNYIAQQENIKHEIEDKNIKDIKDVKDNKNNNNNKNNDNNENPIIVNNKQEESSESNSSISIGDNDDDDVLVDEQSLPIQQIQENQLSFGIVIINFDFFGKIIREIGIKQQNQIWRIKNDKGQQNKVSTQVLDSSYWTQNWYNYRPYISLKHSEYVHYQQLTTTDGLMKLKNYHKSKY